MKNYILLLFIMATVVACSTTKKIPLGQGSTVQVPPNAKQLSKEQFAEQNQKNFKELPLNAYDNLYLVDNVLISFWNIKSMAADAGSLKDLKKDWDKMVEEGDTRPSNKITLNTVNNNQVLIRRIKSKTQINVYFHYRDMSNKLTLVGSVKGLLADSTKADHVVAYMTSHVKFGQ